MELKLDAQADALMAVRSSNRTFMELKYRTNILINRENNRSNRTFMELK